MAGRTIPTDEWVASYCEDADDQFSNEVQYHLDDLDLDAEYYIYTIKLRRFDGEEFYYIGSVSNGYRSLFRRLKKHYEEGGHCSAPVIKDDFPALDKVRSSTRREQFRFIGIESIKTVEVPDSRTNQFLREVERETAYECAIEHDTTNVLGGK